MEFSDRIIYSNEQMMQSLENGLEQLNALRYDGRYRQTLGDDFVNKLNFWQQSIRAQKDNPFTVVVIGDFKRGKSTFINALLGEEIAPTDVTTETVTLNKISYGAHSNEAQLSGSRRVRLSDQELKRENLEGLILQAGEPIQKIELRRSKELLKKITILDTPGTGDAMQDFSDVVKESLLQADAVIYVYNAQYPLSMTEQLFLKSAVLPQKHTSLFLVGNFADTLGNKETYDRVRAMLESRVNALLPGSEVLMISALDELCRQLGEERPNEALAPILEEQFGRLRLLLDKLVEEKADAVVLDRMQRLTGAMLADLNTELDAVENGLNMDETTAKAAADKLLQDKESCVAMQETVLSQIDEKTADWKAEANRWLREFLRRIEDESLALSEHPYEMLLKYYEFYCVDMLQQAISTCVEHHQELMYDEMELISDSLSRKFALGLENTHRYGFRMNLNNRIWTKGDTVGFAVSYVSSMIPLASVVSLVVDGITGQMRQSEAKKSTPDIMKQIASQLPGLNVSVSQTVEKIYTDLGEKAKKLVLEHFAEKMEEAEHLVTQSTAVARKAGEEKAQIRTMAAQARELLKNVTANL